eukprot:CAMPEP_0179911366 /NCGR_PEP_ID=MMETSP0982-20121206/46327_1 /TAXON_ID=483367 /ORGANISM="non described non described, Strain CCMP 2436" /LENGTH=191 /DNA_ID=CAMNT_0021813111 /DNA_START=329 /DNA_END=903 /DNA_ORIENTATION=-
MCGCTNPRHVNLNDATAHAPLATAQARTARVAAAAPLVPRPPKQGRRGGDQRLEDLLRVLHVSIGLHVEDVGAAVRAEDNRQPVKVVQRTKGGGLKRAQRGVTAADHRRPREGLLGRAIILAQAFVKASLDPALEDADAAVALLVPPLDGAQPAVVHVRVDEHLSIARDEANEKSDMRVGGVVHGGGTSAR